VVVMQHGRVSSRAAPRTYCRRPRDDYTRMLIRSVPVCRRPRAKPSPRTPIVLQTTDLNKTYVSGGFFAKRREIKA